MKKIVAIALRITVVIGLILIYYYFFSS